MELSIQMAVAAIQIDMGIIKCQPGDRVYEIIAIPGIVTVIAVCVHLSDSLPGGMTTGALQLTVVTPQPPVGGVVLKRWLLFVAVTFVATITLVTVIADCMDFFL